MNITRTLYVSNPGEWRRWLQKNYKVEKEIWLIYYRKDSGKPRILYNDAVAPALSFGWIDSTVKNLDESRTVQKFSPRRPKAPYSQANKERLKKLVGDGLVVGEVMSGLGDILNEEFEIPKDILKEIRHNKQAWANFQKFSQSYVRIRIAFIDGARRRPAEFRKRLDYFLRMTEKNKQFGFGGIEKYF